MNTLNNTFFTSGRELLLWPSTMALLPMFFAIILLPALWAIAITSRYSSKERQKQKTFPLMKLPAEIRLAVFEYLIDDEPTMPKIIKCSKQEKDSALRRLVRRRLYPASYSLLNSLTLVNRQIRDEFLVVFCQKTTFSFTLDASNTENDSFWKLSPRMLSSIRKCKLKLLASPGIVGAFDPRHASGRWVMRDKTILMLGKMQNLVDVQLSIQACGNQLWNPIWLWHYTSQSFKQITMAGFTRISFKLEEEMKMREPNNLANGGTGPWHWRCSAGHRVLADPVGSQPIRQFCGALFADCNICDTQAQAP